MSIVDVLVLIIVVTILVTIVLGISTYLAYKLRLARRPVGEAAAAQAEPRYFQLHLPSSEALAEPDRAS